MHILYFKHIDHDLFKQKGFNSVHAKVFPSKILPYVTESRKMVPNHTFLFHYIYYCNTNSIAFSTLLHEI